MSLIKCKECGNEISNSAKACPKCGKKNSKKPMGVLGWFISIFLVLFLIGIIMSIGNSLNSSTHISSVSNTPIKPQDTMFALPGSEWSYFQEEDEMSKGTIYRARVSSTNTVNFDSPYEGEQHATLTLRTSPRQGKDVILQIKKGQFLCSSYEQCNVLVRFDDEQPVTYSGLGPSDNSTETVFILNYAQFIEHMLKAKRVRIAANIYQEGAPVFEFNVSNFDQAKYKPPKLAKLS
jgi:hypothetical protein